MNEADLRGILLLIIPRLVDMISKKQNLSEKEALSELYSSTLYAQLCRDEALHTTGRQYIVDDIDTYIDARKTIM